MSIKNKIYICAGCDGKKRIPLEPGNLTVPCGYCNGVGSLPSKWWHDSVKDRCGKEVKDSIQTELELI